MTSRVDEHKAPVNGKKAQLKLQTGAGQPARPSTDWPPRERPSAGTRRIATRHHQPLPTTHHPHQAATTLTSLQMDESTPKMPTMSTGSISLLLPPSTLSPPVPTPPGAPIRSSRILEERSVTIVTALDDGSSANPGYAHLAPNHVCEMPGDGVAQFPLRLVSRDDFVARRAAFKRMHPSIQIRVTRTTSRVGGGECGRAATVYVTCHVGGYTARDMKARESVVRLEWRFVRGKGWVCWKSVFVHGHAY